jgi:hypothetical protein
MFFNQKNNQACDCNFVDETLRLVSKYALVGEMEIVSEDLVWEDNHKKILDIDYLEV